jgi:hypothetical protein
MNPIAERGASLTRQRVEAIITPRKRIMADKMVNVLKICPMRMGKPFPAVRLLTSWAPGAM